MADDGEGGRKLRTKQRKKYNDQDIDEDDIDGRRLYSVEEKLLSDAFQSNMVQELKGPDFTMEWMQKNGLLRPIVFYDKTGLGLRVPSENFKVSDVKQCVGSRRILDVMDVTTQKAMEMSMKEWVKYYENPERDRLLNVISLEFCHTRLENYVESPTLVRQIDWVDRAWPKHLKECQTESTNVIERMKYPKVQKYCLMSVAGCYTDFHIDFGGTSVWYHILHGEKIFWLAPPSQKNIDRYVEWTLSAKQGESFLGDTLESCQRIRLLAGYTFIIPSGWIHAVFTPKDSLVFGGNFLHSYNVENQLLVSRVEDKTYVPSKFKYPFYQEIMWYVMDRYLSCLTGHTYLTAGSGDKDEGFEDDDQGLIQVDEDSRPPSRNPDSRPPSRAMEEVKSEKEEESGKISTRSVTVELTRIDAGSVKRSPSEDENQPPISAQGRPRGPRKAASDPNNSWEGGGPKRWVHMTGMELKGVAQLLDYLTGLLSLPVSKRGVPRDLYDPEALLKEMKEVLEEHHSDDATLAVTGEPVIGWPELMKKKQKLKLGYKTYKTSKGAKGQAQSGAASSNVQRRRRTRCKKCEACTRTECGECTFCKDMKKFGGPGRMKQTCISRQCMAPILPSGSVCMLCNQGDQSNPDDPDDFSMSLMECGICWEIVHPKCLYKKFDHLENEGVVNEDLPSSWECGKCCTEGKQGQLKARIKPGFSTKKAKSEDSEGSQEEEGGGPLSPMTPVEGKRVTAKEGGGLRCEFGTPIKWSNSLKRCSPMSEFNMTKEGNERCTTSPSPHFGDENNHRKATSFTPSHQKEQKKSKREKSPPTKPSTPEEGACGAKKRQTPEQVQQQTPGIGGKRPKREGTGWDACESLAGYGGVDLGLLAAPKVGLHLVAEYEQTVKSVSGGLLHPHQHSYKTASNQRKRKGQDEWSPKEEPASKQLKQPTAVKAKRRSENLKARNDNVKETDTAGAEPLRIPALKTSKKAKDSLGEVGETTAATISIKGNPKLLVLKNSGTPKLSGKSPKHVTFEDYVETCVSNVEGGASNLISSSCAQKVDSKCGEKVQEDQSMCSDTSLQARIANVLERRFDPIRGHRLGKRPMYRGNADWSKDFVPRMKKSLLPPSTAGLQLRLAADQSSEERSGWEENKSCSQESYNRFSSGEQSCAAVPQQHSKVVMSCEAATAPFLPLTSQSHCSEEARVGCESVSTAGSREPVSAAGSRESEKSVSTVSAAGSRESEKSVSSVSAARSPAISLKLVEKLRDTLVSQDSQSALYHSTQDGLKHADSETVLTSPTTQRIIVKDCSSALPGVGTGRATQKSQTVIVRRLSGNQYESVMKSCGNLFDNVLQSINLPAWDKTESDQSTTMYENGESCVRVNGVKDQASYSSRESQQNNLSTDSEKAESKVPGQHNSIDVIDSTCSSTGTAHNNPNNDNNTEGSSLNGFEISSQNDLNGVTHGNQIHKDNKVEQNKERKSQTEQNALLSEDGLVLISTQEMLRKEGHTAPLPALVGSPPGTYQPLLFDHPYCQISATCDSAIVASFDIETSGS